MMSLAAIQSMSKEAGERAAKRDSKPYVFFNDADVNRCPPFPFPNIGDYEPEGWELADKLFADKLGVGAPDEPALTIEQFKAKIRTLRKKHASSTVGFAIIEEGQFQVCVGVFLKTKKR